MPASPSPLPANVVAALRSGNKIEAIKLLREATGLGLKESKDAIDAYPGRNTSHDAGRPSAEPLRSSVAETLLRGNTVEAIRLLLREKTGLASKEAKDRVDAAPHESPWKMGVGAPGEVPRSGSLVGWIVAVGLVALIAYYLLRTPG